MATAKSEVANIVTERVKKRKEEWLKAPFQIHAERCSLVTEAWRQSEGERLFVRAAKAFKNICENIPVVIREGELIVGSQSKSVRGAYPEVEVENSDRLREQILGTDAYFPFQAEKGEVTMHGKGIKGVISEEDRKTILECLDYWAGKSPIDIGENLYRQLWGDRFDNWEESKIWVKSTTYPAARTADFPKVLNIGLEGIIAEAKGEISKLKIFDEQEVEKLLLLQAMIMSCEAAITFAKRHAELARSLAQKESVPARKAELEKIAEICDRVPAKPARNFHEALQSSHFIMLTENLESGASGETPGRLDQYLYPFYEKDIREGILDQQSAGELLGLFWVKMVEFTRFGNPWVQARVQGSHFINVTIGGVKPDGSDGVNELSFLILEVIRQLKTHQPHVSLRYHDGIDKEFMVKAVEAMRDHGGGIPAFFNDKVSLPSLIEKGLTLEEARDYTPQGCVERCPWPGTSFLYSGPFYNLAKILELTLYNGMDRRTGKQIGISTGDPTKFKSFEEFYGAFKAQTKWFTDAFVEANNVWASLRCKLISFPYLSSLSPNCIESGTDALAAGKKRNGHPVGVKWNHKFGATLRPVGIQNTANSLSAIKKVVYEDKKVTMGELLEALNGNFDANEELQKKLLAAPKYGNDDDYVDLIMRDLFSWIGDYTCQHKNAWGEPYVLSCQSQAIPFYFGKVVGALPDGRKAWEHLADGSVSAMRGTDKNGPIGVIQSASKVDQAKVEATLMNLKFSPGPLKSRQGIEKFNAMLKTYFDQYGYHCQVNVLSRDTLLDAKAHPENYRDLVVRVAGFSAYFVLLSPEVQDDIITRTEHVI